MQGRSSSLFPAHSATSQICMLCSHAKYNGISPNLETEALTAGRKARQVPAAAGHRQPFLTSVSTPRFLGQSTPRDTCTLPPTWPVAAQARPSFVSISAFVRLMQIHLHGFATLCLLKNSLHVISHVRGEQGGGQTSHCRQRGGADMTAEPLRGIRYRHTDTSHR